MDDIEKLPVMEMKEDSPCPYFDGRNERCLITAESWMDQFYPDIPKREIFGVLLELGFRRSGTVYYKENCNDCSECIPIRLQPGLFEISKSQRRVARRNADIEVRINDNSEQFATPEKAFLYREYDYHHNHKDRMTLEESAKRLLDIHEYEGCLDMEYYLNGRLIAVGIIDIACSKHLEISALSSNYFYYEISEEVLKRSIGVFSVLAEIDLCNQYGVPAYYLGLYLPNCRKMNYKINYQPYELYENDVWTFYGVNSENYNCTKKIDTFYDSADKNSLFSKPLLMDNGYYKVQELKSLFKFPSPLKNNDTGIVTYSNTMPAEVLISAYYQGIFPWFNEDAGESVIWHNPEKRFVIQKENLHIPKSLAKFLKNNPYTYTVDTCFEKVIEGCRKMKRPHQNGTWIGNKITEAYTKLHLAGYAHSIEVWNGEKLAGGFYGILIGSVFAGESMFTIDPDSSKSAFALFANAFFESGGKIIDCQVRTDNMERYGGTDISRVKYEKILSEYTHKELENNIWQSFLSKSTKKI